MTNPVTATTSAEPRPQGAERIVEWPPRDAFEAAEQVREKHGYNDPDSPAYGRLTAPMITQLARIAQTIATPDALITTEPPTEGKPYQSTGLNSLQPQIDVMHAIFGPSHWRLLERELEDGVLDLELVIGNSLDRAGHGDQREADVLARHRMRGSHTRGRSHGDRYKGALTNGAKRLLAMAGACADVWRFGSDPDEAHNTPTTGARDARRPSDKQVSFLARLVRENAGANVHRWIARIQELAGVEEQPPDPITEQYLRALIQQLDRDQVRTMIDALISIRDERAAAATRTGRGPAHESTHAAGDPTASGTGQPGGADGAAQRNGGGELVRLDIGGLGPSAPDAA
jgi:hypothetical protein